MWLYECRNRCGCTRLTMLLSFAEVINYANRIASRMPLHVPLANLLCLWLQLLTILEENHHGFLIIEHDPLLYEDATEMVEYVVQALRQTSREATILLYSPSLDPHLDKMTEIADRAFCFYEMPKAPARDRTKDEMKMPG